MSRLVELKFQPAKRDHLITTLESLLEIFSEFEILNIYYEVHNILSLFDALTNFSFTTCETIRDY